MIERPELMNQITRELRKLFDVGLAVFRMSLVKTQPHYAIIVSCKNKNDEEQKPREIPINVSSHSEFDGMYEDFREECEAELGIIPGVLKQDGSFLEFTKRN